VMNPPARLPASRRAAYQYKWLGWLAVAGFAVGLTVMFFISGMFGVPAPLGWAFLVIVFSAGALLLDRPKLLLNCMLFYFLLMPSNRLFGLVGLPLPGFIDELFFLPFIAVIVMNWIQRRQLREATIFPVLFCFISALSWYVNGKPSPFTAVQVTLIMLKFYILWYFCRLTCTFGDQRQLHRWMWVYIVYIAAQFLYNILWQGGPWARLHPDRSGGVFGPDTHSAHMVGYLSVFALIMLASWWMGSAAQARRRVRRWAVFLVIVICYNLIFMTDTKHALVLCPFAFFPLLFHPSISARMRTGLIAAGVAFAIASVAYFNMAVGEKQLGQYWDSIEDTPKADLVYAVTSDFQHLVPYPILGAGPGRFTSNQARDSRTPLARRYILPYYDEARRLGYYGRQGTTVISSVVGAVNVDFLYLMGEFGWLGTAVYYWFLFWVIMRLLQKARASLSDMLLSGAYMGLACCLIFVLLIMPLSSTTTIPVLMFPLWMLIGRSWDMPAHPEDGTPPAQA